MATTSTLKINSTTTHSEFSDATKNLKVSGSYDKSKDNGLIRVICSYIKENGAGNPLINVGNASYTLNPDGKQYNKNVGCVEDYRDEIETHFNALITSLKS